jgi:hypothetical protein
MHQYLAYNHLPSDEGPQGLSNLKFCTYIHCCNITMLQADDTSENVHAMSDNRASNVGQMANAALTVVRLELM